MYYDESNSYAEGKSVHDELYFSILFRTTMTVFDVSLKIFRRKLDTYRRGNIDKNSFRCIFLHISTACVK